MLRLYDAGSNELLGTISPDELQYLVDQLEEEDSEDQDYYIDRGTLAWFEEQHADSHLLTLLREAIGDREGMDVRWEEE
jgi:processive 1,2-diacylglycerol beta-glucosyltransferase